MSDEKLPAGGKFPGSAEGGSSSKSEEVANTLGNVVDLDEHRLQKPTGYDPTGAPFFRIAMRGMEDALVALTVIGGILQRLAESGRPLDSVRSLSITFDFPAGVCVIAAAPGEPPDGTRKSA